MEADRLSVAFRSASAGGRIPAAIGDSESNSIENNEIGEHDTCDKAENETIQTRHHVKISVTCHRRGMIGPHGPITAGSRAHAPGPDDPNGNVHRFDLAVAHRALDLFLEVRIELAERHEGVAVEYPF